MLPLITGKEGLTTRVPLTTGKKGITTRVLLITGNKGITSRVPFTTGKKGITTREPLTTGKQGLTTRLPLMMGKKGIITRVPLFPGKEGSTTPTNRPSTSSVQTGGGGGTDDAAFGEVSGPCFFIECPAKPSDENCTEYFDGCCTRYICGDLPRNCQEGDAVYEIGQSYEPDKCYICYCRYSEQGAVLDCYKNTYCRGPPHKDCVLLGKPQDKCCEEYDCSETTCKLDGNYYGINEEWVAKRDPCKNCTCIKTGSEPPQSVCVETVCPAPPSPVCRPLKYAHECCPHDWDCTNDYLITTARKYVRGQKVPVCVFGNSQGSPVDLTFQLSDKSQTSSSAKVQQTLSSGYSCAELDIPNNIARSAVLNITGTVGQTKVQQENQILTVGISQTFVQTDKYLYLPGQLVQFRILTLNGTQGYVSYEPIESIWIQSPSGNRLTQWTNLSNPDGLVQLSFQLAEEVEEGEYKIKANTSSLQEVTSQTFEVKSYVLPRFTVTLDVPSHVLATATEIPFTVCGKYTYGKPVKGAVTFNVTLWRYYGDMESVPLSNKDVDGCWEGKSDLTNFSYDFSILHLKVTATFVEEGTQVEVNTTKIISIVYNKYSYEMLSDVEYFRHGLPFPFKLKVTREDSEPISGKVMSLCVGSICKNFTLDATGIIDVLLPSSLLKDNREILVKPIDAGRDKGPLGSLYTSNFYYYTELYYSPSKSGLQLEMPSEVLTCNSLTSEVEIPVFFVSNGTTRALIRAQLVSTDQVLWTEAKEYDLTTSALPIDQSKLLQPEEDIESDLVRGSFVIKVPMSSNHLLDLKVLIWHARTDGEVVSESGKLKSEQCLNNPISLTFSSSKKSPEPKDPVALTLSAAPKSVCGIGVVDRSVEILSRTQSDRLTNSAIFGVINKARISRYENTQINTQEYCYGSNNYNYYGFYDDGIVVEAPVVERSIPYYYSSEVDAIQAFSDTGLLVLTDLTVETRPCRSNNYNYIDDYFYAEAFAPTMAAATSPALGEAGGSDVTDEGSNRDDSRDYFPETWLWQMVVMGEDGQNQEDLQLPDTITEWVGEAVCTHPEKGLGLSPYATITTFTPFFMDMTLPPSARRGEDIPILVSVFNYQNETLPVTITLVESSNYTSTTTLAELCVSSNDKRVAEFIITPLVVGDVNLTFTAAVNKLNTQCSSTTTLEKSDTIIKPLRVKFEGVIEEKVVSDYFCLVNGQLQGVPEPWFISTPEGIIPDSERIFVSATKDIMGPTLENLGNLIRMPYGCGEQNMLTFTPNIYVLQYLEAIGQSTPTAEQNAKTYMEAGYQRELTYRRDDGSYSAFGRYDAEGSTLLTAFVLRSFAQAARFITIDEDELKLSTSWLLGLQDKDGCFALKGTVHHKDLLGGVDGKSLVPLTAYVLISMLESGRVNDTSPVTNAISCITSSSKTDPYANSLIGYALALASDTRAKNLVDTTYSTLTTNPDALNQPTLVETAGYTLLAMMKVNQNAYVAEASKMAKLISSNRNGQGGFVSTQDTVIGLQSLATFSEKYPSPTGTMNLGVSAGNETLTFTLNDANRLLMNTKDVTQNPPFNVSRTATGEGCALVMLVQRYNVPELKESTAFSLSVTPTKLSCTSYNIEVCASYLLQDGSSNMAVIEVDLETGFSAVRNDLQSLVDQNKIKRHEEDDGVISLYLDAVTSSQTCLVFGMTTETKVNNASPGTVSVYDYYEPKEKVTQKYVSDRQGC
ncbi:alpha-2-macroglobulin-like protein 1 [Palaemon carinicauda]|uniref:alpha-2-macroglobulin-like protein 1 n=1 Tax=Palaemon carinicauda TaxID=392227 RepID=UPI0035B6805C